MSTENHLDYWLAGFDLVDEQLVSVVASIQPNHVHVNSTNSFYYSNKRSIQNQSIVSVGNSHWLDFLFVSKFKIIKKLLRRISSEFTNSNTQSDCCFEQELLSVELIEFSLPNPSEYAVEILLFGNGQDRNGYYPNSEDIVEVFIANY